MRATRRCAAAALLWLAAAALPAAAQEFPALYSVAGVAADDVLNIRSAPSASAEIIGTLAPDQAGVEVVAADGSGTWGLVNSGERSGWAALRYLTRASTEDGLALPRRFSCFGTEPFWILNITQDGAADYATPGGHTRLKAGRVLTSRNHGGHYLLPLEGGAGAVIRRSACSDGMSDRTFGLSVDLFQLDTPDLQSGCCSLAP
ncbi:peptide-binding protein [Leisingera aquaemixtae]|uniref:COG3650 family protein n=1 Tax=Leisingera aquaemixtae TaxID=1396826 RepID=UPI001151B177|nr:SH3 domain-containing protein [Leisingera aquaemixtae]QDI77515.1 peptide-binding protein [Leisingera aquaemixtae]UWQ37180.1 SH3 domain-containing protein [Leisingera aquaemixtae]